MKRRHVTKGQTIIIMALGAVLLLGIVAIAVDGGSAMLQRRNAQNGADAGALAGVQYMANGHMTVSCLPTPCHPAYTVTNDQVAQAIDTMAAANRGGAVGTATYSLNVEYHYVSGANAGTYQPAGTGSSLVPSGVDGLRVHVNIAVPTTFGKAINFNTVNVSAMAAARIYPTCLPSTPDTGPTLPFTRFRPRLEEELSNGNLGNEPCHPLAFWNPQGDVDNNSNFNNMISFNLNHLASRQGGNAPAAQQVTQFDTRFGPGNNYQQSSSWGPSACIPFDCADMRGQGAEGGSSTTGAAQDIGNWSYWIWQGRLSISTNWNRNTQTWYPANRTNDGGTNGGGVSNTDPVSGWSRLGDWADVYQAGQWGSNVQESIHDLANDNGVIDPVMSGGSINWGKYVTRTMFLWGNPLTSTVPYRSYNDAQAFVENQPTGGGGPGCNGNNPPVNCPKYTGWEDVVMTKATNGAAAAGNYYNANYDTTMPGVNGGNSTATIGRVHFTRALTLQFFANLQGNYGANEPPGGCSAYGGFTWSPTGSIVWGLLPSTYLPGPQGGGCTWTPGGGCLHPWDRS